jgi:hypothetical protein
VKGGAGCAHRQIAVAAREAVGDARVRVPFTSDGHPSRAPGGHLLKRRIWFWITWNAGPTSAAVGA